MEPNLPCPRSESVRLSQDIGHYDGAENSVFGTVVILKVA
jgi:hypothetical protein